jgi:putative flavoprotein involved in K+ transport
VRGVVPEVPRLYFVGLMFLYAGSSVMVHGVSRDAARIADLIAQSSDQVANRQKRASSR